LLGKRANHIAMTTMPYSDKSLQLLVHLQVRFSLIKLASDEPLGSPRRPRRKALFTFAQFSPGASVIGPEVFLGHWPVRLRWASAHARIFSCANSGRFK